MTGKELLDVVFFVKYFRRYLYGRTFLVRTDHGSLRWVLNFKNPEGQLARWIQVLSMYEMTIEHRPGAKHRNADSMSYHICKQCDYGRSRRVSVRAQVSATLQKPGGEEKPLQSSEASKVHHMTEQSFTESTERNEDHSTLKEQQLKDADVCLVRRWVETGQAPDEKVFGSGGVVLKSFRSQRHSFVTKDGILYRKWYDEKGTT